MLSNKKRELLLLLLFSLLLSVIPAAANQLDNNRITKDVSSVADDVESIRMEISEQRLTSEGVQDQPGSSGDFYGWDVAIDGNTAIVGSYRSDINALQDAGVVYVYERGSNENSSWTLSKVLEADDASIIDLFGISVAIDGDTIVVGAAGKNLPGGLNEAGAVYIFERHQGGDNMWGQVASIQSNEAQSGDKFGFDVSIDGDFVIAGAPGVDIVPHTDRGAAYVFGRNQGGDNNWGQITRLFALDGDALDSFGQAVSISDEVALVGAPNAGAAGFTQQGVAYMFEPRESAPDIWTQIALLEASDKAVNNFFGASVDISSGNALIGAWGSNGNAGAAYIFSPDSSPSGEWEQLLRLVANDGISGDRFGWSVSIHGGTAVVGANNADVTSREPRGSAYLFQRYEGGDDSWGRVARITASDGTAGDTYGNSVAVYGVNVIVGSPGARVGGNSNQGASYGFDWQRPCTPVAGSATSLNTQLRSAQCNPIVLVGSETYEGCFDVTHDTIIIGSGAGEAILDGEDVCTTVSIRSGLSVEIKDLTITGGNGTMPGATGGGILNDGSNLIIENVEVSGNRATYGGAIYNSDTGTSEIDLISSTIAGNTASAEGGGLFAQSNAKISLNNATFSGNNAPTGGAISSYGELLIANSTLAKHSRDAIHLGGGMANIGNSILAENQEKSCRVTAGTITSDGHNLSDDTSCSLTSSGDQQSVDAKLVALDDNGGPTRTHALELGSPAIDKGSDTICTDVDQRGVARPFGASCDIGSFEADKAACTVSVNDGAELEKLMLDDNCGPIIVPPGTYVGCFEIDHNTNIIGQGADSTIIQSAGNCPVIKVAPGVNTDIISVTLTAGTGEPGGAVNNNGGIVDLIEVLVTGNKADVGAGVNNGNGGTLTIDRTTISGNTANTKGGGINNETGATLKIVNSTISGNAAPIGGAVHNEGVANLINATIADNANDGIYNRAGSLQMVNTIVAENETLNCIAMGGLYLSQGSNLADDTSCQLNHMTDRIVANAGLRALSNYGGVTPSHALSIESQARDNANAGICGGSDVNSIDQRNVDRPWGPGCDIGAFESDTGRCDVAANNSDGLLSAIQDEHCSPVVVEEGTYTGCFTISVSTELVGAGSDKTFFVGDGNCTTISVEPGLTVDIESATIQGGESDNGGGVYNNGSDLTIRDVVVAQNTAELGGGVYNDGNGSGTVTIINSSVSQNVGLIRGGGIFNGTGNKLGLYNSTVSSNTAYSGGGVYNRGEVDVINSTVAGNRTSGIHNVGTVTLANTIVAENSAENCTSSGGITSNGYNLTDDGSCMLIHRNDIIASDAGLSSYRSARTASGNGAVHLLNVGSPALNAGSDEMCAAYPINNVDQRGMDRPQQAQCDIGAVEMDKVEARIYLPIIIK